MSRFVYFYDMIFRISLLVIFFSTSLAAQPKIGLLKYGGGGDWYANPTSLPNLVRFINEKTTMQLSPRVETVEVNSPNLYQFQMLHTTGHGNIVFTEQERLLLRRYLLNGGFLHVDDNYGLAPFFKKEVKKIFPDKELKEIPRQHPIFNSYFTFPNGLPKIHEHDGKPPIAYGIFDGERLLILFTTECDLGDGWEDSEVHNDPPELHQAALEMGANIVAFIFLQ